MCCFSVEKPNFDHALYYQRASAADGDQVAARSTYAGLVDTAQPKIRRTLHERSPNQDTWIT